MKFYLKVLTLVVMIFTTVQISAQEEGIALKKGSSLSFELGFPGTTFGAIDDLESDYGIGYGVQMGSRWYLKKFETGGIALMVNWFSAHYAQNSEKDFTFRTLDLTFAEVGAMYTYALSDDMAIDGYYNLEPAIMGTAVVDSDDDGFAVWGFGITHALGAAFRYKIFNIGFEHHFGKINGDYQGIGDVSEENLPSNSDINSSTFKILLGVKF